MGGSGRQGVWLELKVGLRGLGTGILIAQLAILGARPGLQGRGGRAGGNPGRETSGCGNTRPPPQKNPGGHAAQTAAQSAASRASTMKLAPKPPNPEP
eukprot:361985-Chlamydomonas_euryale.AAC.2